MSKFDPVAFVKALSDSAAEHALRAIEEFEREFPEPRSHRDIDVGLAFEARALRHAADVVDRRRVAMLAQMSGKNDEQV